MTKEEIEQAYKDGATIKFKLSCTPGIEYLSVYNSSRIEVTWDDYNSASNVTSYALNDMVRNLTDIWGLTQIEVIPLSTAKSHPKAEWLKLYADGVELEFSNDNIYWSLVKDDTPWIYPYYRVKKETKKVKVYRWVAETNEGKFFITDGSYSEKHAEVSTLIKFIQKIDSSEKEIEVEVG